MRPQEPGVIRRNVDVIAIAVLLGGLALGSTARQFLASDSFAGRRVLLDRTHHIRLTGASCPLPLSLVLR